MDWQSAIKHQRTSLAAIAAALLVLLGDRSMRGLHAAALRILLPAESALRRLIVLYHRHVSTSLPARHRKAATDFSGFGPGSTDRPPAFRLIDPRKRFVFDVPPPEDTRRPGPRIWALGMDREAGAPAPAAEMPARSLSTAALARRVAALDHALNTLPAQARRLARLMARRAKAPPGPGCVGPVRPGLPPGYRRKPVHAVDHVLIDCHGLVVDEVIRPPP